MSTVFCEICGRRKAVYICQACDKLVCKNCISLQDLICNICKRESKPAQVQLFRLHIIRELFPLFFFFGITLIVVGLTLVSLSTFTSEKVTGSVGGFIWIFPFPPIMLGTGSPNIILPIFFIIIIIFIGIIIWNFIKTSRI